MFFPILLFTYCFFGYCPLSNPSNHLCVCVFVFRQEEAFENSIHELVNTSELSVGTALMAELNQK